MALAGRPPAVGMPPNQNHDTAEQFCVSWRRAPYFGRRLFIKRASRGCMRVQAKTWERKLTKLLSFIAVAALALSFSSGAKAQAPSGAGAAKAAPQQSHHWQPKKHYYGKRLRA